MELEQWAAYLPYDITVYGASELWTLKGIDPVGSVSPDSFLIIENGTGLYDGASTLEFSPILRPLSDLTKEITVEVYNDGKPFVPKDYWVEKFSKGWKKAGVPKSSEYKPINAVEAHLDTLLSPGSGYRYVPYWIANDLFRWHFDVFGLIEKGEAIDINTLS